MRRGIRASALADSTCNSENWTSQLRVTYLGNARPCCAKRSRMLGPAPPCQGGTAAHMACHWSPVDPSLMLSALRHAVVLPVLPRPSRYALFRHSLASGHAGSCAGRCASCAARPCRLCSPWEKGREVVGRGAWWREWHLWTAVVAAPELLVILWLSAP